MLIKGNLFCCLSENQQEELRKDIENKNYKTVYHYQKNLKKEKNGYRCLVCGRLYPFLRIQYEDKLIIPENFSKLKGKQRKCKKAAVIFNGNCYYAQNKKALQKFGLDTEQNIQQTDEIPIMGNVYHVIMSPDERYIATETFGGTLGVVDICEKQIIAKKQKCKINGSFVFSGKGELLYFKTDAIRRWSFVTNQEETVWEAPAEWKKSIVCNNVIHNAANNTDLFQCAVGNTTYIVIVKNNDLEKIIPLSKAPTLCKLVYVKELNLYTLVSGETVHIYDENFNVIEKFTCPNLIRISNGGGFFPVTQHNSDYPQRVFLSPNGKWILLDYFTSIILMKHKDYELKYCLFSYTGRTSRHMGFLDDKRFWYTWGDTTYIQEI